MRSCIAKIKPAVPQHRSINREAPTHDLQIWLKRGWALAATRGDAIAHIDVIGRNILNDEDNSANG